MSDQLKSEVNVRAQGKEKSWFTSLCETVSEGTEVVKAVWDDTSVEEMVKGAAVVVGTSAINPVAGVASAVYLAAGAVGSVRGKE